MESNIENDSDLVDALNTPGVQDDEWCVLDPNVPEDRRSTTISVYFISVVLCTVI